MDFILNGQGQGSVASRLLQNGFDVRALRPWVGQDGRHYIAQNQAGSAIAVPTLNANATLRKDEWIQLDTAVVRAAKERLRLVADLRGAGLEYSIANGMGKTTLETETMGDITPATISMDPTRKGEADRPEFDLTSLPLPVIHKDFFFNARQVAASRSNPASNIDTTTAELAARRVAEEAEKLAVGVAPTFSYGGGTVYGLINSPNAITTIDLTSPPDSGWTPAVTVAEVLQMRQASMNALHYGPWRLYNSPAWDQYFDADYSAAKGDNTLRERLQKISGISGVQTLDFLPGYRIVLVQMTSDVVRMVIGMDITTVQWETEGGMRLNFKVLAIMVPQIRADFNGNTGIVSAVAQ